MRIVGLILLLAGLAFAGSSRAASYCSHDQGYQGRGTCFATLTEAEAFLSAKAQPLSVSVGADREFRETFLPQRRSERQRGACLP
jgi:hypothetical protein